MAVRWRGGQGQSYRVLVCNDFFPLSIAFRAAEATGIPRPVARKTDTAQASETLLPELLPLGKRRDSSAGWEDASSRVTCIPWELHCRARRGPVRAWVWGVRGLFGFSSFPGSSRLGREGCLPASHVAGRRWPWPRTWALLALPCCLHSLLALPPQTDVKVHGVPCSCK